MSMSTLSGKKMIPTTALVVLVLLFVFQGTAPAARLAGNAQPVSTLSTESRPGKRRRSPAEARR